MENAGHCLNSNKKDQSLVIPGRNIGQFFRLYIEAGDKQHVFFSGKLFQNLTAFPFKCDIDS